MQADILFPLPLPLFLRGKNVLSAPPLSVIFVGGVPNEEVKNYLFASDLFLFSSRSETQGIVLAEAMAAGLPAAAVEAYGVNDIVRDKYNGLLCEESVDAFAENMKKQ